MLIKATVVDDTLAKEKICSSLTALTSEFAWGRQGSLSPPGWLDAGPTSGIDAAREVLPAINVDV